MNEPGVVHISNARGEIIINALDICTIGSVDGKTFHIYTHMRPPLTLHMSVQEAAPFMAKIVTILREAKMAVLIIGEEESPQLIIRHPHNLREEFDKITFNTCWLGESEQPARGTFNIFTAILTNPTFLRDVKQMLSKAALL